MSNELLKVSPPSHHGDSALCFLGWEELVEWIRFPVCKLKTSYYISRKLVQYFVNFKFLISVSQHNLCY